MYKSGYALSIISNGNNLKEDDSNKVAIPFGIEYSVRLINKNFERCGCDLVINGDKISRFILNSGETSDIERYLDGNLNGGSRFKFTHLHDSKVKDPSSFENGLVEAYFYKEIFKPQPVVIEKHIWHEKDPWDRQPWKPPYQPYPNPWSPVIYGMGQAGSFASAGGGMSCSAINTSYSTGQDGATVRGSKSSQKFQEVSGLEFDSTPTILRLKLVNGELTKSISYCVSCGRKRRDLEKYCSNCGVKFL